MTSFKGTFSKHIPTSMNIKTNVLTKRQYNLHHLSVSPWKRQAIAVLKLADIAASRKATNPIYSMLRDLTSIFIPAFISILKYTVNPFWYTNRKPHEDICFSKPAYFVSHTTWWFKQQSSLICHIPISILRTLLCWLHKNLLSINLY